MTDSIYSTKRAIAPATALHTTKTGQSQADIMQDALTFGQPDTGFQDLFGAMREDVVGGMLQYFSDGSQDLGSSIGNSSFLYKMNTKAVSRSEVVNNLDRSTSHMIPGKLDSHIRWGQLGNSLLGLFGNGLGVTVGSALLGAPDPTMGTKVVGGVVLGKSIVGWGLNWYNLVQSVSQPSGKYDAPSSTTRAIASAVAPGNDDAQRVADVVDLSIDLMSGRCRIYPYGTPTLIGSKGVTALYNPASKLLTNPSIVPAFQGTQVIAIGVENATR